MGRISLTVSELFQTGKMPSEIFKILKPLEENWLQQQMSAMV